MEKYGNGYYASRRPAFNSCNEKRYDNMKRLSVLFIMLCLSAILCAKDNYEQGYIITNQQDTISGWINLRTDKNNQKRCEFKQDLELAAKIYLPEDIAGYRFTDSGKYYVSREIRLNETSPLDLHHAKWKCSQ